MDKPYLLVDVDGVLNVFGGWSHVTPESFELEPNERLERVFDADGDYGRFYTIRVPTGTARFIERLEDLYECAWATTWEDRAPRSLSPALGFGADWPVVLTISHPATGAVGGQVNWEFGSTWKLPSLRQWCEENAADRAVAWIDDDNDHEDAVAWAADRGARTLLATCDPSVGITEALLAELEEFARG